MGAHALGAAAYAVKAASLADPHRPEAVEDEIAGSSTTCRLRFALHYKLSRLSVRTRGTPPRPKVEHGAFPAPDDAIVVACGAPPLDRRRDVGAVMLANQGPVQPQSSAVVGRGGPHVLKWDPRVDRPRAVRTLLCRPLLRIAEHGAAYCSWTQSKGSAAPNGTDVGPIRSCLAYRIAAPGTQKLRPRVRPLRRVQPARTSTHVVRRRCRR